MKNLYRLIFVFCVLFSFVSLNAQMVRLWKNAAFGGFTGSDLRNDVSVSNDGIYAVIGNDQSTTDSVFSLYLSEDKGISWVKRLKISLINNNLFSLDTNELNKLPADTWLQKWLQNVTIPSKKLIIVQGYEQLKSGNNYHPFILRSTDMGVTFKNLDFFPSNFNFGDNLIEMINDTFGVMLSGHIPNDVDPGYSGIYKTYDGGKTWNYFKSYPFEYPRLLKCFSEKKYIVDEINQNNGSYLLETDDGGETWNKIPKPDLHMFSFINDSTWILTGYFKINTSLNFASIYKTKDAGKNWNKLSDSINCASGFTAKFLNDSIGLACDIDVSHRGNIYITSNFGRNWDKQILPSDYYEGTKAQNIEVIDTNHAIVLMIDRILSYSGEYALKPPTVTAEVDSNKLLNYTAKWDHIIGGDKYKLQLAGRRSFGLFTGLTDAEFDTCSIFIADNLTDTTFDLKGKFKFGWDFFIRVKAYNDSMESDWSKQKAIRIYAADTNPRLQTVNIINPPNASVDQPRDLTFIWHSVEHAESYVLWATRYNFYPYMWDFIIPDIKDTTYTLHNLLANRLYYWYVTAEADGWATSGSKITGFTTADTVAGVIIPFKPPVADEGLLYPNPAGSVLNIKPHDSFYGKEIYIYSAEGRLALEYRFRESINISALPPGAYFLQLDGNMYRFVKE